LFSRGYRNKLTQFVRNPFAHKRLLPLSSLSLIPLQSDDGPVASIPFPVGPSKGDLLPVDALPEGPPANAPPVVLVAALTE
jgi:hypothetical protein